MKIQTYKAKIRDTENEVTGYICEIRKELGNGSYGDKSDYIINVTEISMPNSTIRGSFFVDEETIEKVIDIDTDIHISKSFEKDLFKLINDYCKIGLKKPDLFKKMEWATGNCKTS